MNDPTITVIIPSFGREEALLDNVKDLLKQSHQPNEIFVVLQKPDCTKSAVLELRGLARHRSHLILKEVDFANAQKARNLGIKSSNSEILLILDDDLRVPPNLIEMHLGNYLADPGIDGVVGQVLERNQPPTDRLPKSFQWPHLGWQHLPLNYAIRTKIQNWPSTNSSIKRRLALEIGGFDEQFECTWCDDADFSCRLIEKNANLLFEPKASVTHLKVPGGGKRPVTSPSLFLNSVGWGTHFYFWRKNYGIWKARYSLIHCIRYYILRKAVLLRPFWLIKNLKHLFGGWTHASKMLKIGPIYLK